MNWGHAQTYSAPAKVNLWLGVGDRRPDGYHSVDTVLLALELADEIRLSAAVSPDLIVQGDPSIPQGEENLCWSAQTLFVDAVADVSRASPRRIHLHKRIPAGAGLGGGSADAAAVLLALNEELENPLSSAHLTSLGAELGSDVPFFLSGSPMAIGSDRGQKVVPLSAPPARPVLILVPDFGVSTAQAYGWLDQDRGPDQSRRVLPAVLSDQDMLADWETLDALAANDFEAPVFRRHQILETGKRALLEAGASLALLCGSGSCLFGVFEDADRRDEAADSIPAGPGDRHTFRSIRTRTAAPIKSS